MTEDTYCYNKCLLLLLQNYSIILKNDKKCYNRRYRLIKEEREKFNMFNWGKIGRNLKTIVVALIILLTVVAGTACNKAATTNGGSTVAVSPQNKQANAETENIQKQEKTRYIPLVMKFWNGKKSTDKSNKEINKIGYWDLEKGKVVFEAKGYETLPESCRVDNILISKKEQKIKEIDHKVKGIKGNKYIVYKDDLNHEKKILINPNLSILGEKYKICTYVEYRPICLTKNQNNQIQAIIEYMDTESDGDPRGTVVMATEKEGILKDFRIIEPILVEAGGGSTYAREEDQLVVNGKERIALNIPSKKEVISEKNQEWIENLIFAKDENIKSNGLDIGEDDGGEQSWSKSGDVNIIGRYLFMGQAYKEEWIDGSQETQSRKEVETYNHSYDAEVIAVLDKNWGKVGWIRAIQYDIKDNRMKDQEIARSSLELYDSANSIMREYSIPEKYLTRVSILENYEVNEVNKADSNQIDIEKYKGEWIENHSQADKIIDIYEKGGQRLNIEEDIYGNINGGLSSISIQGNRCADVSFEGKLDKNVLKFSFDDDGFFNSGTGKLTFGKNKITGYLDTKISDENLSGWSIGNGEYTYVREKDKEKTKQ